MAAFFYSILLFVEFVSVSS